jgi:hypothetical protein
MSSATAETPATWNICGGLIAAFAWGIFGSVAAALAVLILKCAAQWDDPTFVRDLRAGQVWSLEIAILPMIGCSAIFAAAGWVAKAMQPPTRMFSALAMVASGSMPTYLFLTLSGLVWQRPKMLPPALIHPPEFFALVIPPLIVAACATYWRQHRDAEAPKAL